MTKRIGWKQWLTISLVYLLYVGQASANELIIGTTFSNEALTHLIDEWHKQPKALPVRTLNRTSNSLTHLLATEQAGSIDLILSSSPMLFYNLQAKQKLAPLPATLDSNKRFVPEMLQQTTVAFSLSGYGVLSNIPLLENVEYDVPTDWEDLAAPHLQGLVIISSPTRSDTNHIMIEALLQKHGWQQGWALIHQIMANVGTISSRSFGVADKIQANLGAAGITIDNYANLLIKNEPPNNPRLTFKYFPDFPVSPTFIAMTANGDHPEQALAFIRFLLSKEGQTALYDGNMGKYPIMPLPKNHPLYDTQQFLFSQPQIDYKLMLQRQEIVKLIFEHQILYRLNQIQENWQMLYQKEQQRGNKLTELRQMLSAVPVSETQAQDADYLKNFNANQELLHWQQFFISQQSAFIRALEKL